MIDMIVTFKLSWPGELLDEFHEVGGACVDDLGFVDIDDDRAVAVHRGGGGGRG